MFHVNHSGGTLPVSRETAGINLSFTNTEVFEDLAEHVLDSDLSG